MGLLPVNCFLLAKSTSLSDKEYKKCMHMKLFLNNIMIMISKKKQL